MDRGGRTWAHAAEAEVKLDAGRRENGAEFASGI
jgi:hypothetical protein